MKKTLFLALFSLIFFSFIEKHPFSYDLHPFCIPGKGEKTMICFHGMGGDYRIAEIIKNVSQIDETLVSFNFPDHGIREGQFDAEKTTYGTIQELLPALYVLKKCVVEDKREAINLYGFSAGGGAIVNIISVLTSDSYDSHLQEIGISQTDKEKILAAIQKGTIILDTPLKSLQEVIDYRPFFKELDIFGKRYKANQMEPIEALKNLEAKSFNIIVHFQNPDETLSNRDDSLFIERLKQYNAQGKTEVLIASDSGHSQPHPSLWKFYSEKR